MTRHIARGNVTTQEDMRRNALLWNVVWNVFLKSLILDRTFIYSSTLLANVCIVGVGYQSANRGAGKYQSTSFWSTHDHNEQCGTDPTDHGYSQSSRKFHSLVVFSLLPQRWHEQVGSGQVSDAYQARTSVNRSFVMAKE